MNLLFEEMSEALISEGTVEITGFGKFVIFDRKKRMGINPVNERTYGNPSDQTS